MCGRYVALCLVLLVLILRHVVRGGLLTQLLNRILHSDVILLAGWYPNIPESDSKGSEVENAHVAGWGIRLCTLRCCLLALALLPSNSTLLCISSKHCSQRLSVLLVLLAGVGLVVALCVLCRRRCEYWSSARGTHLLSLQPTTKTAEMQDVPTWELLRPLSLIHPSARLRTIRTWLCPGPHLLATDDACILSIQFFCCRVWIACVHVAGRVPVLDEVVDSLEKGSYRHEQVSHNMDRYAVECHKNDEEAQIDKRLDEVGREVQVKDPAALFLPPGHVTFIIIILLLLLLHLDRRFSSSCCCLLTCLFSCNSASLLSCLLLALCNE